MVDLDRVRLIKKEVRKELIKLIPCTFSIGITKQNGEYVIIIGLKENIYKSMATKLPHSFDGVTIVYHYIGEIVAQ